MRAGPLPAAEAPFGFRWGCMKHDLKDRGSIEREGEDEPIRHLKEAVAQGKHWYIALLEAIGLWTKADEVYDGRRYCYLIDNEAFDWLLLCERLCHELEGLAPQNEVIDLLFSGRPPIELSEDEFRALIGEAKHHAHLNFFYGVTVEEALLLAVEDEARKEQRPCALFRGSPEEEAYQRIYGAPQHALLKRFRQEKRYTQRKSMGLAESKEFTYWLFKHRLRESDKARVASDTRKALGTLCYQWTLKRQRSSREAWPPTGACGPSP